MSNYKHKAFLPDLEFWKGQIPCQVGCPVHTDAGKYVQSIAEGADRQGYLVARSPNPLASACGRVCAAPCEDRCRRGKIDRPVSIRALKRYLCELFGVESEEPNTQESLFAGASDVGSKQAGHLPILLDSRRGAARESRVAVIGAGPAGLACAHDLALMGYRVTVFEATGQAGGMMVNGIPEFRLPRATIQREIEKVTQLGVEIRYNAPLTDSFGLSELRAQGFRAIFLGVGVQRGRDLRVEGADLDGVIKAVDYLLNVNNGYRVSLGRKVVVIGGGFVAFDVARMALRTGPGSETDNPSGDRVHTALDAARAAIRSGAMQVHMASLESFAEMPVMRTMQGREEFEQARREGVEFLPQRSAARFCGHDGRVQGVEFVGVSRTYDENGRFSPQFDQDVRQTLEADTVILAIGQQADLSFLKPEDGVELAPQGTIKVDPETLATTAPDVFAGGDVAFGPRNLIEAVANGKRAALSIDDYLGGTSAQTVAALSFEKIPTRNYQRAEEYEKRPRKAPPTIPLNRRTGIAEVEVGFNEAEARRQAERCLYCHIQTIYDPAKCVMCGRCVDVCPESCLKLVPLDEVDLDPATRDAVLKSTGIPSGPQLTAMLKDDDRCIRCGLCAVRCPTEAMTMEVFHYEERQQVVARARVGAGAV